MVVKQCPKLTAPKNGVGCGDSNVGALCEPKCDKGYAFYTQPVNKYHCGELSLWIPSESIPKCLRKYKSEENN